MRHALGIKGRRVFGEQILTERSPISDKDCLSSTVQNLRMSHCIVNKDATSCKSRDVSSATSFGVELVQTIDIIQSGSELTGEASIGETPNDAEYKDLGDAIASILSSPSSKQQLDDACSTGSKSPTSSLTQQDVISVTGEEPCSPVSPAKNHSAVSSESEEDGSPSPTEKKHIKLPQRKGGMQLWQFLYALLSDPQYKDMIEWTSNVKEREFRLHEPEAIAIWWGDHKNKRNMSYDKLSRSLRYYYDKGIIRKINGQRYVYRFCVAPEVMYRHIGNSDCRPKLKPMSIAARNALSTANSYQNMSYLQPMHPSPHPQFNPQFIPYASPSFSTPNNFLRMPVYPQPPVCTSSPPSYDSAFSYSPNSQHCYSEPPNFQVLPPVSQLDQLHHQISGEYHTVYPHEDASLSSSLISCEGSPSPQSVVSPALSSSFPVTSQTPPISPPLQYNWNLSPSL